MANPQPNVPMSNTAAPTLFTPFQLGPLVLPNRVVLAPMTRVRADAEGRVRPMTVEFYAQRATGGLLVTEATQILPNGKGGPGTPGIHSDEHVAAWRQVTDAVHARGGRIVVQLWHSGRAAHPSFLPAGAEVVGASPIPIEGEVWTPAGRQPYATPRPLTLEEIPRYVAAWVEAAHRAVAAGFDGVEIHAANGYLLDQFLRDGSNHRTDAYGGPIEHRARFLLEVTAAVAGAIGAGRVGVRVSPTNAFQSMQDSDPAATFGYVAAQLARLGIAYLHVQEGSAEARALTPALKRAFGGPVIVAGGYDADRAEAVLGAGTADLVAFGVAYLANPDLPERLREGAPLNTPDPTTFYGGDERGYVDYPTREVALAGAGAA
jgi:N-ethylmaleimide reductase